MAVSEINNTTSMDRVGVQTNQIIDKLRSLKTIESYICRNYISLKLYSSICFHLHAYIWSF